MLESSVTVYRAVLVTVVQAPTFGAVTVFAYFRSSDVYGPPFGLRAPVTPVPYVAPVTRMPSVLGRLPSALAQTSLASGPTYNVSVTFVQLCDRVGEDQSTSAWPSAEPAFSVVASDTVSGQVT